MMTPTTDVPKRERLAAIIFLRELIAALDRRVPQLEREGEAEIAHESAMLKQKALIRLAELEGPASDLVS